MDFEWDPDKARSNLAKHGVSFERAAEGLAGWSLRKRDLRVDYGEERWIALARSGAQTLVVAYTMRGGRIRIISARRAGRKERQIYDAATKDRL